MGNYIQYPIMNHNGKKYEKIYGSSHYSAMGSVVSLQHQDTGSFSAWHSGLKDPTLPKLSHRWQLRLGSDPWPRHSICRRVAINKYLCITHTHIYNWITLLYSRNYTTLQIDYNFKKILPRCCLHSKVGCLFWIWAAMSFLYLRFREDSSK